MAYAKNNSYNDYTSIKIRMVNARFLLGFVQSQTTVIVLWLVWFVVLTDESVQSDSS